MLPPRGTATTRLRAGFAEEASSRSPLDLFLLAPSSTSAPVQTRAKRPGQPLLLQVRFDPFFQFLIRHRAFQPLAVDEEGRRRVDLQHLKGKPLVGGEL